MRSLKFLGLAAALLLAALPSTAAVPVTNEVVVGVPATRCLVSVFGICLYSEKVTEGECVIVQGLAGHPVCQRPL